LRNNFLRSLVLIILLFTLRIISFHNNSIYSVTANTIESQLANIDVSILHEVKEEGKIKQDLKVIYDPIDKVEINIDTFNQYSEEELQHFNGIGPSIAKNIKAYIKIHGDFKKFSDLIQVKGIGEKKLDALLK